MAAVAGKRLPHLKLALRHSCRANSQLPRQCGLGALAAGFRQEHEHLPWLLPHIFDIEDHRIVLSDAALIELPDLA